MAATFFYPVLEKENSSQEDVPCITLTVTFGIQYIRIAVDIVRITEPQVPLKNPAWAYEGMDTDKDMSLLRGLRDVLTALNSHKVSESLSSGSGQ